MPNRHVVAAVKNQELAARLVTEARLLWDNGHAATAAAIAVAALEADAKANEMIAELTGIPRAGGRLHTRRIEGALASLAGIFAEDLQAILGTQHGSLTAEEVWRVRQRALYVDLETDGLHTADEISTDVAAAILAAAINVSGTRGWMSKVDPDILAAFFVEYGDLYRQHMASVDPAAPLVEWAVATARFAAELGQRWYVDVAATDPLQRV